MLPNPGLEGILGRGLQGREGVPRDVIPSVWYVIPAVWHVIPAAVQYIIPAAIRYVIPSAVWYAWLRLRLRLRLALRRSGVGVLHLGSG